MEKLLKPIMFVGTGSDVGKSMLVTGFCRILKNRGYTPAPFKAQNMSLNSFATPDGFEIGRAQAVQAEACTIDCHTDMNPILLKPSAKNKSQVVLNGKPIGEQTALDYFSGNKMGLFEEAKKAFHRLNKKFHPIVMEGAGSISELNLKHRDIVNMRMAQAANAKVILVADIDKGGVFGSVYGTLALLEPWEKEMIIGVIINKFRGDARLFEGGKKQLEELTKIPVLGVIPYAQDIYIEEEDSVALNQKNKTSLDGKIKIAVVLLPYLSNYTDFNYLEQDNRVHLYYTNKVEDLVEADIILLPGTKNTLSDLQFLRKTGLAQCIIKHHKEGKKVYGICGGYQMMGEVIHDFKAIESEGLTLPGLGILPLQTTMTEKKKTVQRKFKFLNHQNTGTGYEIHMGETISHTPSPFIQFENGEKEGFYKSKNCWGTYLHGIFDNKMVIDAILENTQTSTKELNYQQYKNENYNKLAVLMEEHLDVKTIIEQLKK